MPTETSAALLRRALPIFVAVLALGLPASTCLAEDSAGSVLTEARKMFEASIAEDVVWQWLTAQPEPPEPPSAEQLIALKQAGASDGFLSRVLELAQAPPQDPPPAPRPVTPVADPAPEPTAAAPPPPPLPDDGTIPIYFEMSYVPRFEEGEDEWELYVYLDGKPLTFVPAGSILGSNTLKFRDFLPPGRHVLRVAQERHERRGRDRWFHAARVPDVAFDFEVGAGATADVELRFRQPRLPFGTAQGPLSFRFVQGRNVVAEDEVGAEPEDWRRVCEEIEANARDDRPLKKALRKQLEDCVRWSDLWSDAEAPGRDEVRQALEHFRYRPIPKDQL